MWKKSKVGRTRTTKGVKERMPASWELWDASIFIADAGLSCCTMESHHDSDIYSVHHPPETHWICVGERNRKKCLLAEFSLLVQVLGPWKLCTAACATRDLSAPTPWRTHEILPVVQAMLPVVGKTERSPVPLCITCVTMQACCWALQRYVEVPCLSWWL